MSDKTERRDPFARPKSPEPVTDYTAGQIRRPRRTRITPHERNRKRRMVSFTFPDSTWPDAIRAAAEQQGLGLSEFATRVFAQALAAVQRGEWEGDAEASWTPEEP
ncbi:MAG: hypothetical protein KKA73_28150 [Chloroflexi bacterium]|nr:hypothetical protein [Chloroflexota bacterium]